ncbi:MAG: AMP-binding protein [Candidatus Hodarchaeales archaeon]|jgi:long-chain acyl-CoA synthetase
MEKLWLKHYPDYLPFSIQYPEQSVYSFLEKAYQKYPNKEAIYFYGVKYSYHSLKTLVDKFTFNFEQLGLNLNDRVLIFLPNSPHFVISFYACLRLGVISIPTNPLYKEKELKYILQDSDPKFIITNSDYLPIIRQSSKNIPIICLMISNDNIEKTYRDQNLVDVIPVTLSLNGNKKEPSKPTIDPMKQIAVILYTGGTTFTSKGVMLSHYNLVVNTLQVQYTQNMSKNQRGKERILAAVPIYHSLGLTRCVNLGIYMASSIILIKDPRNITDIIETIKKTKPTYFPGVSTLFKAITQHKEFLSNGDFLSSVKLITSGAMPLFKEVYDQIKQKNQNVNFVEVYGLTECSPVTHSNPVNEKAKLGSIGFPVPDTDCKIINPDKEPLEMGIMETGELCIKGFQIMVGYWNDPESTSKRLKDGWMHTGDIACVDKEGYFYIKGRIDDIINVSGNKVYPLEIEKLICSHPKISEALVGKIKHRYSGEAPKAYIKLKEGARLSEEKIMTFLKQNLSGFKIPKEIEIVESLPTSLLGKKMRDISKITDSFNI